MSLSPKIILLLILLGFSNQAKLECTQATVGSGGFGILTPCGTSILRSVTDAPALINPPQLTSVGGVLEATLEVQQDRVKPGPFSFNSRVFCSNGVCGVPGPTIEVSPGDTVQLTLQNSLITASGPNHMMNANLGMTDVVNIHTHGLHVDPSVDNAFVQVKKGESKLYQFTIPNDHMPGIHWHHPHVHGSSAIQIAGGLVGAILVLPKAAEQASYPTAYTDVTQHTLVITHHPLCTCNPTTDPFRIFSMQDYATRANEVYDLAPQAGPDGLSDGILVNGQWQPKLEMLPGEYRRFDIVNAVADIYLEIEVRDGITTASKPACTMKLLAIDGVFLKTVRDISFYLMAPGSRGTIAITCTTAGTVYLLSYPQQRAADNEVLFLQNLVTLVVAGTAKTYTPALTWDLSKIPIPSYLADLTNVKPYSSWEIGVEQTGMPRDVGGWLGIGKNCTLACSGRDCPAGSSDPTQSGECSYLGFEGADKPFRHVGKLCSIEEVIIRGRGRTPHPIHIHVNHMQIISVVDDQGQTSPSFNNWGQPGDWRDTVPAWAGTTTLRMALSEYGGQIMVHCHFLFHEDMGMMTRFYIGEDETAVCTVSGGGSTGKPISLCSSVPSNAMTATYPSIQQTCTSYLTAADAPAVTSTTYSTTATTTSTTTTTNGSQTTTLTSASFSQLLFVLGLSSLILII